MDAVAEIRAFNRLYTRRIGVLEEGLHDTGHPLPDARVLYELGQAAPMETRDLLAATGMDPGFLSRVLRRLEVAGLVARTPSADDARRHLVALSSAGQCAFAELDARSAKATGRLAAALGSAGVAGLRAARAVLDPGPVALRTPEPGDLGWIVARHGALYAEEHGWDARFEALVAKVVASFDRAAGRVWIATVGDVPAGCVMLVSEDERTARLRLLLVEPHARGLGLGGRLVDACLDHARDRGDTRMVLWTNDVLEDARRLYDRRGFTLIEEAPHADFGPPMVGQTLVREL